jgi:hypothetical protein
MKKIILASLCYFSLGCDFMLSIKYSNDCYATAIREGYWQHRMTYPIDGPYEVECYGLKGVKHEFIKGYKR